ncbi:replication factor C subunit 3-like isoform X2 [Magnolia sinica]|uniref:replication factor C subunit 3-like isoform X2 n=1 Tax=Magnolia sinica TaxID=86752 RepID=UPI0026583F3C|nr:replication factor C subunit 3-like isoform X2 [Magnolia sinica]
MSSRIPHPSSLPDISKTKRSFPCNSSTYSSSSSYYLWFLPKFRKSSKNLELTEESLSEHNLRQAKKISTTSPYYKGLTDSQLYINRIRKGALSPSRESHATRATATSSISTALVKLGTVCFKGRGSPNAAQDADDALPPRPLPLHMSSPPKVVDSRVSRAMVQTEIVNSMVLEEIEAKGKVRPVDWKPLRKRVSIVPPKGSGGHVQGLQKELTVEKFTWANKYRPMTLKKFICNRDKAELLQNMVAEGECSHLIFEGCPGVGKKTMIWAFLREAFGPNKLETREELKKFELKGEAEASIEVNVRISSKHVEINLSELRGHEKHVIVSLIEESNVTTTECDHTNCRVIVLYQADRLSTDAQHYIRWIMERYKGCNKILFCCSDISRLQPIRPICTHIHLLPPSKEEIVEVLEYIAEQEGVELPHHLAERIAENSKQNLRQAIRSFEATRQLDYPFKEDQVIWTGWEEDIANIAKNIIDEQSPKQLYIIRGKLQNLIEHNVSPEFIFSTLVGELKKRLDDHLHPKIDSLYLEYNEESGRRNTDAARKNVHHFMRIEGN